MEQKLKKQYVKPILKEHGVVRELTQASSGGRGMSDWAMSMSMGMSGWAMSM